MTNHPEVVAALAGGSIRAVSGRYSRRGGRHVQEIWPIFNAYLYGGQKPRWRRAPQQAQIAYLRYCKGLSTSQIAGILGTSGGTVRKQLSRLRMKIERAIVSLDPKN